MGSVTFVENFKDANEEKSVSMQVKNVIQLKACQSFGMFSTLV